MSARIQDGQITLDVSDLLAALTGDDLIELINRLAIQDSVIQRVAQQIAEGCTDDGWCGATTSISSEYPTPLMSARRYVASHASAVAAAEIDRMQFAITSLTARNAELLTSNDALRLRLRQLGVAA